MPWIEEQLLPRVHAHLTGAAKLSKDEKDALVADVLTAMGRDPETEAQQTAAVAESKAAAREQGVKVDESERPVVGVVAEQKAAAVEDANPQKDGESDEDYQTRLGAARAKAAPKG
jgi:hypothetical protein